MSRAMLVPGPYSSCLRNRMRRLRSMMVVDTRLAWRPRLAAGKDSEIRMLHSARRDTALANETENHVGRCRIMGTPDTPDVPMPLPLCVRNSNLSVQKLEV